MNLSFKKCYAIMEGEDRFGDAYRQSGPIATVMFSVISENESKKLAIFITTSD
jgi:hypothetical protein